MSTARVAGITAAFLLVASSSACVNTALWNKKKIHKAHSVEGQIHLQADKHDLALAHFNAALEQHDANEETIQLRQTAATLVATAQLEKARSLADKDGLATIRIVAALRGSGPIGIHIQGAGLDELERKAAQTESRTIEQLAAARKYYPALVRARAVAAALPQDKQAEARLRKLGQAAALHHRALAIQGRHLKGFSLFHQGLAELFAKPLAELRDNINETERDRPNRAVTVQQVGKQDCSEILRAVEDELRKTTSQIVKATFSIPFCAVGAVAKKRQESYTYWAQIPYQVKGYKYVSEVSGSYNAQTTKCGATNSSGRCTSYYTTTSGGSGGILDKTYRLVKRPAMVTKYRREKRTGTRTVDYTQYNAGAVGQVLVSVAGSSRQIQIKAAGKSDQSRQQAVQIAAAQLAKRVAQVSQSLADRLAGDLRRKARSSIEPMLREENQLLALAVLGKGREPELEQRYGIDGTVVRDILAKQRQWPPIGLPKMVALPSPGKTQVQRSIEAGNLRPPVSLDEDSGSHIWASYQFRNSYIVDIDRIGAIEVGYKGDESRMWASLGLSAFGGDGSSFELAGETRYKGYLFSALVGGYFALELGPSLGEDADPERNAFAGLGAILGGQLSWWRFDITSRLMPNAFQLFGTGDETGTSRPTPWLNSARVHLPLGFFAQATGGAYLGVDDPWVWNLSAGWKLEIDD